MNHLARTLCLLLLAFPTNLAAQSFAARRAADDSANRPTPGTLFDFQVDRPAKLIGKIAPRYPESMRNAKIEGAVLTRFEVDTLGAVDLTTLRVLRTPHEDFAPAVREALGAARFRPARNKGHLVRQVVMQPFAFALIR